VNTPEPIDWSFEASRVRGRLVNEDDIDLYRALYADADVMRYIAAAMGPEQVAAVFANALRHNANPAARARYWRVSHQRTGQTLGLAGLVRDASLPTRGELGLMLLPRAQHTGVGVQTLECLVDGVLSQRWALGMDEVAGRHAVGNIGAGRLVEHLGFERFDIDTPGSMGWRMTADVWGARLALRAPNPQHR
jgi:RimJ/RimL family protein N-acetyltransferase